MDWGRVGIRFGAQELFSGQPTSMNVPVTAVKLVGGLAASIVAIHRQLPRPDAFLPPLESGAEVPTMLSLKSWYSSSV